ncbi:hypothetical protein TNIN_448651 [Trichonephila inaurata madagascariensis]|uniref:Uncharacterized protein n=1 Tax=Trichonephila inaurata madagascariensis TaxID=2747483 RepID=A0A8X6XX19_9ARAC|nr:hypothetical protein TNIN_448651 [Trichonephila inaurata madagascariensis]
MSKARGVLELIRTKILKKVVYWKEALDVKKVVEFQMISKPSVLPVLHLGYCCIVRITHIPCSHTNPRCSCHVSLASADNYRLPKSSDAGSFGPKETEKTADRGRSS